ncbi:MULTISPECIES: hypothetical protein [unclassified Nocardia]|uniref:hypothetical protein n=1 Tax=unclassified Nocardia TaxID=2637762 RepID=UPI001CE47C1A|nr:MULTISPECIES: hypothetical protein [unclassified Nocardia]
MARTGAVGYLRRDIAGTRQQWDETQIRSLANRLGFDLRKTITFCARTERPVERLSAALGALGVDTLFVPSLAHFDGGEIPATLRAVTVITVSDKAA